MKKLLSSLILIVASNSFFAQQDIFALTGKETNQIVFQDFRAIDSKKGMTQNVFLSSTDDVTVYSSNQKKEITENKKTYANAQATQMATLAIDARNNLIYMPLFSSNIYVLDSKTKAITLVENSVAKPSPYHLETQFSRMATGKDGNVYALSNSGSQFLKISYNNGKYSVSDLGVVKDDSGNADKLLSKMDTGFGGDMIADTDNNFYIFSASGNIFKLLTNELKAKFIGKVKNLPENYSLNGVAVNSDGDVILASAKGGLMHVLNMETLQAEPMKNNQQLHIYDLASQFTFNAKKQDLRIVKNDVYPTNVTEQFVNIKLNDSQKGNAIVKVYNTAGVLVLTKAIANISNSENRVELGKLISGVYVVNVDTENGKSIISKKIIVK